MLASPTLRMAASLAANAPPMRVAIVGSGPSGFYAAARLLQSFDAKHGTGTDGTEIHMYERLPTPFGLVRYGVAPDHPEVRNVESKFDQVARDPRFSFFGNVRVTADDAPPPQSASTAQISLSSLAPFYTHVLFAYGASDARHLHVPGSSPGELEHVHTALDFVQWYNGHPDAHLPDAPFSKMSGSDIRHVSVIGAGNVAIDVARILLRQSKSAPLDASLQRTDAPESVLEQLRSWDVETVHLYARRGAAQLAFTNKELREMLNLPHAPFEPMNHETLEEALAAVSRSSHTAYKRAMTRLLKQLQKGSVLPFDARHKPQWGIKLMHSPKEFTGSHGSKRVTHATWDLTEVRNGRAVSTGRTETTSTDLVLASVGYRSQPLAGSHGSLSVPFDSKQHIIPNERRRVVREDGSRIPGMYVSGWLATGPVGVIVSTMFDAFGVADDMLADWRQPDSLKHTLCASVGVNEAQLSVPTALREQGKRVVSYSDWLRIDAAERERGLALGKPREKFLSVDEMLKVL